MCRALILTNISFRLYLQQDKLAEETARLDALEGDESNKPVIAKLRHLLTLHDALKAQQEQFKVGAMLRQRERKKRKFATLASSRMVPLAVILASSMQASCQSEMDYYSDLIGKLKGQGVEHIDEERKRAVQQQYEEESKKLQKAQVAVARKTREVAFLERKIDEVPSRAELTQYQRRFVELYEQSKWS